MAYWSAGNRITAERFAKYLQAGDESVSFTTKSSHTLSVVFDTEFDSPPSVTASIGSAPSETAQWHVRATSVSSSGFTLFLFAGDGATDTWANVPVNWTAAAK